MISLEPSQVPESLRKARSLKSGLAIRRKMSVWNPCVLREPTTRRLSWRRVIDCITCIISHAMLHASRTYLLFLSKTIPAWPFLRTASFAVGYYDERRRAPPRCGISRREQIDHWRHAAIGRRPSHEGSSAQIVPAWYPRIISVLPWFIAYHSLLSPPRQVLSQRHHFVRASYTFCTRSISILLVLLYVYLPRSSPQQSLLHIRHIWDLLNNIWEWKFTSVILNGIMYMT